MQIAKLFRNGKSQAVRLPKEFRFEGNQVAIRKIGQAVILQPQENPWETLFESIDQFSPDFMNERKQPPTQKRDPF